MPVIVTGLEDTIKGLKAFDEDALSKFRKVINKELDQAKIDAKALIPDQPPLSGWATEPPQKGRVRGGEGFPVWDAGAIRSAIIASKAQGKVRKGDYTTSAGALINKSAAGVIFEVAGRKKGNGKTRSGSVFKDKLTDKFENASRVVWRIVDRDREKIENNFVKALDEAKENLQKALETPK